MSEKNLSPLEQLNYWKTLTRKWLPYLHQSEVKVVAAILERTVHWGKRSEVIPITHLVDGVNGHFLGTGLSKRQVIRLIEAIEDKGILARTPRGRTYRYEILINVEMGLKQPKNAKLAPVGGLKISKKQKIDATDDTYKGDTDDTYKSEIGAIGGTLRRNSNKKEQKERTSSRSQSSDDTGKSALEKVLTESRGKRKEIKEKARNKQTVDLLVKEMRAVWNDSCLEHFPNQIVGDWGMREKAQVKLVAKKCRSKSSLNFIEFMEWSIKNWIYICEHEFSWMGKKTGRDTYPESPSIGFFCRFYQQFLQWFNDRHKIEGRRAEFSFEWNVKELVRKGWDEDEARAHLAPKVRKETRQPRTRRRRTRRQSSQQPKQVKNGMKDSIEVDSSRHKDIEDIDASYLDEVEGEQFNTEFE